MHGPPLTPQEAVASVARRVRRLEAQGLDRDRAIRRVAVETGIDPHRVRWCAETACPRTDRSPLAFKETAPGHPGHRRRLLTGTLRRTRSDEEIQTK
jgi:hypothetical protein